MTIYTVMKSVSVSVPNAIEAVRAACGKFDLCNTLQVTGGGNSFAFDLRFGEMKRTTKRKAGKQ